MMRKLAAILAVIVCLAGMIPCAGAEVERNVLLDNAFKMLPEGDIFIEKYNQITGAEVTPVFATGIPYFFGGKDYEKVIVNYPQYSKKTCREVTRFFRKGTVYICGLDCHGFISAVRSESGYSKLSPLNFLYSPEAQELIAQNHYRPYLEEVFEKYKGDFPETTLFTIDWSAETLLQKST